MSDREMTLTQFRDLLGGMTTKVVCHPDIEERVRDALVEAPLPHGLWRVQPDPSCPEGKVIVVPPPKPFEWSP